MPEDDPEFQGLLKEEEVPYPNVSAELPGVKLESEEMEEVPAITEDPMPSFEDLAAHIKGAKQDDNYGASNTVLPCPSS